jgi:hypothetical protein
MKSFKYCISYIINSNNSEFEDEVEVKEVKIILLLIDLIGKSCKYLTIQSFYILKYKQFFMYQYFIQYIIIYYNIKKVLFL